METTRVCPKCGETNDGNAGECIHCGIIFDKYQQKINTENAGYEQEIVRIMGIHERGQHEKALGAFAKFKKVYPEKALDERFVELSEVLAKKQLETARNAIAMGKLWMAQETLHKTEKLFPDDPKISACRDEIFAAHNKLGDGTSASTSSSFSVVFYVLAGLSVLSAMIVTADMPSTFYSACIFISGMISAVFCVWFGLVLKYLHRIDQKLNGQP